METLISQRKRLAGFTLIEMAIVIALAAILLSAGLSLLLLRAAAAHLDTTQKHQEAIKQALINYLGKNLRLPCPGRVSDGSEVTRISADTATVRAPCSAYSGIVPYQALGLDRSVVIDGWDNFITYVVSPPEVSNSPTQPAAPAPLLTTAWLYTYNSVTLSSDSPYTKTTTLTPINSGVQPPVNAAFWPSTSTGGIIVAQTFGGGAIPIPPLIANPVLATGAAVVLISHGKNGYGAFNVKGVQNDFTPAGSDEQQNADPAKLVTPTLPPTATVVKRDTTDVTTGGGAFDDIVMMLSAYDLTAPLIANGTLQSSSQAALSQANNIVLGNIVATKSCPSLSCPPNSYSYSLPPTGFPFTPPNVAAWGMSYTQITSPIINSTLDTLVAYTLTTGDGAIKSVSVSELKGIILLGAGF